MRRQTHSEQLPLGLAFGVTELASAVGAETAPAIDTSFPSNEADALAWLESFNKHLFRPNTYLHKWWARRTGTTFRYILKQLSQDPSKRDYYVAGGLEGKTILDPMLGGGTTLHEAIRMGANVIGFDIDPIPVLQASASLTHLSLGERQACFARFFQALSARMAPLVRTECPSCHKDCESQFTLYALEKRCKCGESLFVDSFLLREESDGSTIRLSGGNAITKDGRDAVIIAPVDRRVFEKTTRVCPDCNEPFQHLTSVRFARRYVPIVIFGFCEEHGQFFKPVDEFDLRLLESAQRLRREIQLPATGMDIPSGPKSTDLLSKAIDNYCDLFTDRQLIYIGTCKELLDQVDEAHRLWLGLLISTSLEFNCLLCGYKGADKQRAGAIRHVFSHHAYSLPHTALENNPVFSKNTSGTLGLLFLDRIQSASAWAKAPIERKPTSKGWAKVVLTGEVDSGHSVESLTEFDSSQRAFLVRQQDSSEMPLPDESVDHVVTDPPYFDSVQYSDLAHFFHVWLRWMLPDKATWDYERANSAVAETAQDGAKYQRVLSAIWGECHRVLKRPNGRLIFTFHHWNPEAWAHLAISLRHAGFRLLNSYTISSENPISVHIRQLKALKHDSILVLCPREANIARRTYPYADQVRKDDSFSFCSDCANLLGYCLEADLEAEAILELWQKAI